MSKFDKYYMKQGKLELSMLDEEDEQIELGEESKSHLKKELFPDFELRFPHTKRLKQNKLSSHLLGGSKFKIGKDLTETLQNMGQILNKGNSDDANLPNPNKGMNALKVQKLEEIAGTLKVEEVKLPKNTPEIDVTSQNNSTENRNYIRIKLDPLGDEVEVDITCKFKEDEVDTIINSHFKDITPRILNK